MPVGVLGAVGVLLYYISRQTSGVFLTVGVCKCNSYVSEVYICYDWILYCISAGVLDFM